uniref:Uncharacterized protein n=1 Tax=Lactuca sativa TaxID=4236 RepID=A0A9R1VG60_LACSA|nr:hypothetical protein LSAT_V11C500270440 [Lactuca sativa]
MGNLLIFKIWPQKFNEFDHKALTMRTVLTLDFRLISCILAMEEVGKFAVTILTKQVWQNMKGVSRSTARWKRSNTTTSNIKSGNEYSMVLYDRCSFLLSFKFYFPMQSKTFLNFRD